MKKAFLKFMEHIIDFDCPFSRFTVTTYKGFIEVKFIITDSICPEDLGWLNTHLVDGRWFITTGVSIISLVVRFFENDED